MAKNVYVSQDMSNGYALGASGNDGLSKSTPKLTIAQGWGVMSNDDVMIINDGIYDEASYLFMSGKTNCSITPENDYMVTWTNNTVEGRIFHVDDAASPFTMGALIIDGEDAQTTLFTTDTSVNVIATFDGTHFKNSADDIYDTAQGGTITFQNNFIFENCLEFINFRPNDVGLNTLTLTDGIMINTTAYDMDISKSPIKVQPTATGCIFNASNITMDIARDVADTVLIFGIMIDGCDEVHIDNYSFNATGPDDKTGALNIPSDTTLTINKVRVNNINAGSASRDRLMYGIIIGRETNTNANTINDVLVTNCEITNANHGIVFGFITGAKSSGCTVTGATDPSFLLKGTTDCIHSGGIAIDGALYPLLGKFDTDGLFANMTVIQNTVAATVGCLTTQDNDGVNPSVGTTYKNINVYDAIGTHNVIVCEDDLSTANYYNCNVYQPNGNTANRFVYQATSTDVLTTWETTVNVANTASGNTEVDPLINSDGSLKQDSPLVGTGSKWWVGANPSGANGEPFSDFDTDIGGIQSTFGPFHPKNL